MNAKTVVGAKKWSFMRNQKQGSQNLKKIWANFLSLTC